MFCYNTDCCFAIISSTHPYWSNIFHGICFKKLHSLQAFYWITNLSPREFRTLPGKELSNDNIYLWAVAVCVSFSLRLHCLVMLCSTALFYWEFSQRIPGRSAENHQSSAWLHPTVGLNTAKPRTVKFVFSFILNWWEIPTSTYLYGSSSIPLIDNYLIFVSLWVVFWHGQLRWFKITDGYFGKFMFGLVWWFHRWTANQSHRFVLKNGLQLRNLANLHMMVWWQCQCAIVSYCVPRDSP